MSIDPTLQGSLFCFLALFFLLCVCVFFPLINTDLPSFQIVADDMLCCFFFFFFLLGNHANFWWGKCDFVFVQRYNSIAQMDILENEYFAEELNCVFVLCELQLHKKCNAYTKP